MPQNDAERLSKKAAVNSHKQTEYKLLELIAKCLVTEEKLPTEKQMTQDLCVSRTILRETLHSFEAMGLITSVQGSGWYAKMPDFSSQIVEAWSVFIRVKPSLLLDLLEIRHILELNSLQKAVDRITADQLQTMSVQVSSMMEKAKQGQSFVQEDREFHKILFASTENVFLEQLLIAFWDIFEKSSFNKPHEDLVQVALEHQKELEAIVRRDLNTLTELSEELAADARYRLLMDISQDSAK